MNTLNSHLCVATIHLLQPSSFAKSTEALSGEGTWEKTCSEMTPVQLIAWYAPKVLPTTKLVTCIHNYLKTNYIKTQCYPTVTVHSNHAHPSWPWSAENSMTTSLVLQQHHLVQFRTLIECRREFACRSAKPHNTKFQYRL